MSKREELDGAISGQMTLDEIISPPERLFAVSRIFARARKSMTLAEQKTFVYALSTLKFTEEAKTQFVKLDKKALAEILGINSDENHLSVDLYNNIKELPKHSYIEINEQDIGLQSNGFVITAVTRFRNMIRLRFNEEYMGLFTGLSTNYITMWSSDIFQMQSKRSVQFYELLRQETDTRDEINECAFGVKAIKEMFGIPKEGEGSYMRKDGHFDRTAFEKRVIDPLYEDLRNCKMINLIMQPDGKMYEKVKQGSRVLGYRFYWTFSAYPAVAPAQKVAQLQERIDKDPRVLKVAKDILTGEKKRAEKETSKEKKNQFNNFNQREHDAEYYKELERKFRNTPLKEY